MSQTQADCIPRWSWLKEEGKDFPFRSVDDLRYLSAIDHSRLYPAWSSLSSLYLDCSLTSALQIRRFDETSPTQKRPANHTHTSRSTSSHRLKTQPSSTSLAPGTLPNNTGTTSSHHPRTKPFSTPSKTK